MGHRTHRHRRNARGDSPGIAPGFALPRSTDGPPVVYEPGNHVDEGCVVLEFVAVERLEETRFLDWFQCLDSVEVYIISNASQRNRRPDELLGAQYVPILDDLDGHVASAYGVDYRIDEPGTIMLVDSDGRIRQTWEGTAHPTSINEHVREHSTDPRPQEERGTP